MMIPGIEWLRRSRVLAVAVFVTLGLILMLENTLAHAAQLTVSWSDATPDDHAGFKVERKTGTNGAFAQVTTTGPTVMYHLDTTLTAGTNYCYRVRAYNTAGDSPYTPERCAVAPTPVLRTVTVVKSGTGTGTVGSSPSGITCGSTCSATYTSGTSIALSATPTTGSTFTGWSGACTGTGGCALVLDADKSATAIFTLSTPTTYILTVSKAGNGTGTVTSSPSGISCGSTCSASYTSGTSVTLTAAAATGSTFTGWGGACSGTGTCVVSMNAARTVTPTFAAGAQTPAPLTISSVTANQASPQAAGTPLTLTATATGGTAPYQFKWWVWNGSAWSVAQEWETGNTLRWTPTAPGNYEIHAWVRNSGVTADTWQAWGRLTYTVTAAPAPTMASVTANQASPQPVKLLSLTATATGGTAPYQFKWWVWNGSAWSVARDWGTGNTLTWTPPAPGNYEVHAWVRNSGVTADTWQAWGRLTYTVTAAPAPTMSSVTATQTSPVVAGTALTLTATATGGTAPYQFKWWVWNGSAWSVAQEWGTGNTLRWTPTAPGNYEVHAWVRNSGVTVDAWQAWGRLRYTVR